LKPATAGGAVQHAFFSPDGTMLVTTYGPFPISSNNLRALGKLLAVTKTRQRFGM